jgi:hypothetical protein
VLGLIIGAALMILFAPRPGEATEAAVDERGVVIPKSGQERYLHLVDQLRQRYGDALTQFQETYSHAKDEVLTRYNRAKSGDYSVAE